MELKRISPDELIELRKSCESPIFKVGQEPDGEIAFMAVDTTRLYEKIAQAQLEADQETVEAMVQEMGKYNVIAISKRKSLNELGLLLTMEYWQAFKQKYVRK